MHVSNLQAMVNSQRGRDPVATVVDARFPTVHSTRGRSAALQYGAPDGRPVRDPRDRGRRALPEPRDLAPPQPLVAGHRQRNREVRVQGGRPGGHHRGALPRGAPGSAGGIVSGVLRGPCPGARGAVCVPSPDGVRGFCLPRPAERAGHRETERGDLRPQGERDGRVPRRASTTCGRRAPTARGQDQWPWSPRRPPVELLRGGHSEDGRRGGRQRRADLQQRLLRRRQVRAGPAASSCGRRPSPCTRGTRRERGSPPKTRSRWRSSGATGSRS